MLANLRASHFTFAPDNGSWGGDEATRFVPTSEMDARKLMEDMKAEKRNVGEERERNRRMKVKLTRNTFQIGTEEEYMY